MTNCKPPGPLNECPICLSDMLPRTPRALSCLHTYCQPCLETMRLQDPSSDFIVCPSCRKPTQLQERGISGLPINFLMEHLASKINKEAEKDVCKMCISKETSERARNICLDCHMSLCTKCSDMHQEYKVFQNHTVLPLHESVYCSTHRQKVMYHCRSCDSSLCAVCATDDTHLSHSEDVQAVVDVMDNNTGPSLERYKYVIQSLVRSLDRKAKGFEEQTEGIRREIQQRGDAMKERINDQLQQLMSQLDIASQPTKDLCDKMLQAQMDLTQVQDKLNMCKAVDEPKSCLDEFEHKITDCIEIATELEKKSPPSKLQFLRGYDNVTVGTLINTPYKRDSKLDRTWKTVPGREMSNNTHKIVPNGKASPGEISQNKEVPEDTLTDEEITSEYLESFSAAEQKDLLGVRLYPKVAARCPTLAGKVTGMILELDNDILLYILTNDTGLSAMIDKALAVLQDHNNNKQNQSQ